MGALNRKLRALAFSGKARSRAAADLEAFVRDRERAAAEKALNDAADAHETIAGKDSYGGVWLRARAEAYRQERGGTDD